VNIFLLLSTKRHVCGTGPARVQERAGDSSRSRDCEPNNQKKIKWSYKILKNPGPMGHTTPDILSTALMRYLRIRINGRGKKDEKNNIHSVIKIIRFFPLFFFPPYKKKGIHPSCRSLHSEKLVFFFFKESTFF